MELADGTVQDLVLSQPFEVVDMSTRVRLFKELIDGLAAMHREGFVHRSIWPKNILVKRDGAGQLHVKIADFASACRLEPDSGPESLTREEEVTMVGVPTYFSPEVRDDG
eukprot:CAMPEP_0170343422 /NCGR_PEP_ID=MMETSP0116_2-20130129/72886_1 /TAXON_ID=400756 /ORGANISM="Durinskia baltica, Strain CSIRO CS-38" /LENGTH=109 /DNA_ID=CAMNT_0010597075 /DNA_START=36 /DNA_END=362 /DNA_ORIENTATION=+